MEFSVEAAIPSDYTSGRINVGNDRKPSGARKINSREFAIAKKVAMRHRSDVISSNYIPAGVNRERVSSYSARNINRRVLVPAEEKSVCHPIGCCVEPDNGSRRTDSKSAGIDRLWRVNGDQRPFAVVGGRQWSP